MSVSASLEAKISVPLDLKSLGFGLNLGMENFISVSVSTNWSRSTSLDLALSRRISRDLVSSGPIASLPLPPLLEFFIARDDGGHVINRWVTWSDHYANDVVIVSTNCINIQQSSSTLHIY